VLQHRASQILGQAAHVPARFDVAGQQGQERGNGRVFVLGIGAGHDDFAAAQVERNLPPVSTPSACRMDLGSVIWPLEVSVATS
jgi:hypothetical protein